MSTVIHSESTLAQLSLAQPSDTMGLVEERKIVRVAISRSAKEAITAYAQAEGMLETAILSRMYEWFCEQPEVMQRWVLGQIPAGTRESAVEEIITHLRRQAGATRPAGLPLHAKAAQRRDNPPGTKL